MYKKIFIYSAVERKRNKIPGLFGSLARFLLGIPYLGLIIAISSYFIKPADKLTLNLVFGIGTFILLMLMIYRIFRYLQENTTTFAVDEDGTFLMLSMTKNAASYVDLQSAIMNMKMTPGNTKLKSVVSASAAVKSAMDKIDKEEEIQKSGQGIKVISDVTSVKKTFFSTKVQCKINNKKGVLKIRPVFMDYDEMLSYIEAMRDKKEADFVFRKKTTEEVLAQIKVNSSIIERVALWFVIVLSLAVVSFASTLNIKAKIKHNIYQETEAAVVNTYESKGKWDTIIEYEDNDKKIESTFSTKNKKYENGEKIKVYCLQTDMTKYIFKEDVAFMYKPYVVLFVFGCVIMFVVTFFFKKS